VRTGRKLWERLTGAWARALGVAAAGAIILLVLGGGAAAITSWVVLVAVAYLFLALLDRLWRPSGDATEEPAPSPPVSRARSGETLPGGDSVMVWGMIDHQSELAAVTGVAGRWASFQPVVATLSPGGHTGDGWPAIRVMVEGVEVGFLSWDDSLAYRPLLERIAGAGHGLECRGVIVCGPLIGAGSRTTFSLRLDLAPPWDLDYYVATFSSLNGNPRP
jgi:hypothetical protein